MFLKHYAPALDFLSQQSQQRRLYHKPKRIIRQNFERCAESSPRVVKVVRLHRANLRRWIKDTDIKVNHGTQIGTSWKKY